MVALAIAATIGVVITYIQINIRSVKMIRGVLVILMFIGLIAFDAVPMSDLLSPVSRATEKSWADPADGAADDGRFFWNAIKDWAPYYFVGRELDVDTTGRNPNIDLAIRQGYPEIAVTDLALLDVRAVLTDRGGFQSFADELVAQGFSPSYNRATQTLLVSDRPSTRIMKPTRNVGLLGVAANLY